MKLSNVDVMKWQKNRQYGDLQELQKLTKLTIPSLSRILNGHVGTKIPHLKLIRGFIARISKERIPFNNNETEGLL